MIKNKYQDKRLKLLAQAVVGKEVLDIGYAQNPNKYLRRFKVTGYDIIKPASTEIDLIYHERVKADVTDIG